MNEKITAIKQQLTLMLDKSEDTQIISDLTKITTALDGIEEDYKSQDSKYRELLGNYKEVIKHTSFVPNSNEPIGTGLPKKRSLDDLIKETFVKED